MKTLYRISALVALINLVIMLVKNEVPSFWYVAVMMSAKICLCLILSNKEGK